MNIFNRIFTFSATAIGSEEMSPRITLVNDCGRPNVLQAISFSAYHA